MPLAKQNSTTINDEIKAQNLLWKYRLLKSDHLTGQSAVLHS